MTVPSEAVQQAILRGQSGQDPCICVVMTVGDTAYIPDPNENRCPYSGHFTPTEEGMKVWLDAREFHGLQPQPHMEMWLP